jgi:hypothetical protein
LENLWNAGASGLPAVVAISTRVNKYSVMRGALIDKTFNEFLKDAVSGKSAFVSFNGSPNVVNIEEWDGYDH